jgi:4-amino-4-deoxy-L-arabinose transferase-like glycosyltransferase
MIVFKELKISNFQMITVLFVIAKLLLHIFTSTNYELHRDEMLYFNMGDHLSTGYATVPPVIGFFAFFVKSIFGYSVLGIRLIPALLGAASVFIVAKNVRALGGGLFALIIALSAFTFSPGFLLFHSLFTPNVIEQFFWLLTTYLLLRMVSENRPVLWIWIGVLLGLSFIAKYSVVFFITGFSAALLISNRKLFSSRYFIYALIIGVLIITPNILWQIKHGFPVINHMAELKRNQLDNLSYVNFFTDVFSLNSVSTLIWVAGLISFLFLSSERKYRYLGSASVIIILLILFSKGKGYYILGIIPFLFAAGGYIIEKYLNGRWVVITYFLLTVSVSFSMISLPFGLPLLSFDTLGRYMGHTGKVTVYPFNRWEDGEVHTISQVYADMTGWNELAGYAADTYNRLSDEEKTTCTIFVEDNYGVAGAIHFYGENYNLPEPVTFNESYIFWAPDSIPSGPMIYINSRQNGLDKLFNSITETGCVNDKYFREKGMKVFLCKDPKSDVREIYRLLAIEKKALYSPRRTYPVNQVYN